MELKFYDCFYDALWSEPAFPHLHGYKHAKEWSAKMFYLVDSKELCLTTDWLTCRGRCKLWT